MNIGGTTTNVMIISGGYDAAHDDALPATTNTKGRAVYAVNVITGAKIWEYSYTTSVTNDGANAKDNMTYAIPSDVTILDANNDGLIDRVYVGDTGGQMWRFDTGDSSTSNWTGRIIFKSNPGNDSSTGRKIFYPPDVTFESNYQYLFFGTGDREHPVSSTTVVDRLYAIRDYSVSGFTTEGNSTAAASDKLMDVTSDVLQDSGSSQSTIDSITASLATNGGWYIRLTGQTGEKDLSTTIVLNKVVTYTTYAPLQISSSGACSANLGTGYAYSLNYQNGNSVYDYDNDNDLDVNDRPTSLGAGIPSGLVITITPNLATGLVGVGGGIDTVEVPSTASANKIYWHEPE
jgi:type IV pilus assembly protein PilY1